ncbi:MAG: arginine--tRNA ligase [Bacteroidales bacterium]|jgi:arginyl-tRNA synthetase|nr:arginine--tRNA ligase [Bacteroidales bacterium]MDY0369124.1 arginine--tRNA ligase [Bacteroidales bacterium]
MLEAKLTQTFIKAFKQLYDRQPDIKHISFQKTRSEFEGDRTIVVFPFSKILQQSAEETAQQIGEAMMQLYTEIVRFNVVKGFLNLTISGKYWVSFLQQALSMPDFGFNQSGKGKRMVIEYSSPNTNKPLHLGHIRNNLLGWSVAAILKANGYEVVKVNLINDRGIHICKSMLAWQKWGGKSPEETAMKGDKLVGEMYVRFDKKLKAEIAGLVQQGYSSEEAATHAPLIIQAQEMLRLWEAGDPQTHQLWATMNGWVYEGFNQTYAKMGVDFDKLYYESETYLLGKEIVEEGLKNGALFQKTDGSIWCDLSAEGLDEKLLLRADGTSVYMTQDLGTAKLRMSEYQADKMIYVVGNEQNYHFEVLSRILKKIGYQWADTIEHLSYGMVELPEGKMKSREGTVVDADELMDEMILTAKEMTIELGKLDNLTEEEADKLFTTIGLGALKYFILKVDPRKNMLFNPDESIDFNGNTGPFIQYTHARIRSLLRKATHVEEDQLPGTDITNTEFLPDKERNLIRLVYSFPQWVQQAAESRSPALIANYMYELAKEFNQFYQSAPILREENISLRLLRLDISRIVASILKKSAELLGIEMPEQM